MILVVAGAFIIGFILGTGVVFKAFHDHGLYLDPRNSPAYKDEQNAWAKRCTHYGTDDCKECTDG